MLSQEDLDFLQAYQVQAYYPSRKRNFSSYSRGRSILPPPVSQVHPATRVVQQVADNSDETNIGGIVGGLLGGAAGIYAGDPTTGVSAGAAAGGFLYSNRENIRFGLKAIGSGMSRFKKYIGMGDYQLNSNSLIATGGATSSSVQITPQGNRAIRVVYREYLGDVFTHPTVAGAFNLASYSLNPGLVSLCPWLSPIAQQYEQWTPNGIVFEFKSTSSDYVATQALGSVIMATEYDVLDALFANKQEMLNCCYSSEAKPSERIVHGIECDPRDNPQSIFYIRAGSVPTGGNARDYDLGTFQIATQGGATANLNLGSLYIHYDITFRKEQLFNGLGALGLLSDLIWGSDGVASATPIPVFNGSTNVRAVHSTALMTIGGLGTTITLPAWVTSGNWRLEYYYQNGAAAVQNTPVFTFTTNCAAMATPVLAGGVVGYELITQRFAATATDNDVYVYKDFTVTKGGAVITAAAANLGVLPTYCWVSLRQIGYGYT